MRRHNRLVIAAFPAMLLFLAQCAPTPDESGALDAAAGAGSTHAGSGAAAEQAEVWTCAMHLQIRLPEPGRCPICAMDLVPVATGGGSGTAGEGAQSRRLVMSAEAVALAGIQTELVVREAVAKEIRMVGKVDFDETRVRKIAAWVPGRIDRVFVDFTGVQVNEGDHLVVIYSPDLRTAQEELLQAGKAARALRGSKVSVLRESSSATVDAAREKLRLLGLTAEQIGEIETQGKVSDTLTIFSPIGGTVVMKYAFEGMYVETGTPIYEIADLSRLWVRLDAYESDMSWVRFGQRVEFATVAYPGEVFHGRVSFIEPTLDSKTRTVKLRVNVDNADRRLKPGMFVRAIVRAGVSAGGRVMDPELAGKWIGPMHPEIIREDPGSCPICGMDLVRAEDYGYVAPQTEAMPLIVPATAPLITGERAVVYVKVAGAGGPVFEGREVVLGPRTGASYVVREGLAEGDEVVVKGNFKIDSALQIQARPSMMSPTGGGVGGGHVHGGGSAPAPPGHRN
jgi:Cu(I)/Ag(I) efflux system membrane fusion protein